MAKRHLDKNSAKVSDKGTERKLLLVDEDTSDLEYYSDVLRHLGYEVRSVESYAKAAATLGNERFDLVIVEQGSTDFEGRAVLTRAVEVDRHVPVLVLTHAVDPDCCIDALEAGAHEYVQKPLTATEVRELVGDYVKPPASYSFAHRGGPIAAGLVQGNPGGANDDAWRKAS